MTSYAPSYFNDDGQRLTARQSAALASMRAAFVEAAAAFTEAGAPPLPTIGYPFDRCLYELTNDVLAWIDRDREPADHTTLEDLDARPRIGEDAPEPESVMDDEYPGPCPRPGGRHSWVVSDPDNGGDGRTYCEFCLADGDA